MDRQDRIGVAAAAAAAGTLAGIAARRLGRRRATASVPPLELPAVTQVHPHEIARLTAWVEAEKARRAARAEPDADVATAADPLAAAPDRRSRTARTAERLSAAAVGALATVLVLWSTGTWDAGVDATAGTAVGTLPLTAQVEVDDDAADPEGDDADDTDDEVVAEAPAPDAVDGAPAVVQRDDPTRIVIPALGVDADVIPLGRQDDGALEVPTDFAQTGWWTGGPEPGEPGPAVIVGHVDSFEGPAVFIGLEQLAYDDLVRVERADGSAATFAVRSAMRVDKETFPTDLVYGPTDGTKLRLITCDGDFSDGSYLGNLIVTADLLAEEPAPPRQPGTPPIA